MQIRQADIVRLRSLWIAFAPVEDPRVLCDP